MPSPLSADIGNLRRVIAVIGSGSEPHSAIARPLGQWLAREGYHLLSGGGQGVMGETAAGFHSVAERGGLAIGILPGHNPGSGQPVTAPPGYPNPFIDLAIRTHLPSTGAQGKDAMSRNHLIVLSAHAVVALPGGEGTRSEIELALKYRTPLLLFAPKGEWAAYEVRAASAANLDEAFAWINAAGQARGR